jgi:catechol 2,3-dioxygenase-like lactoylglutathione lyase family enzyme
MGAVHLPVDGIGRTHRIRRDYRLALKSDARMTNETFESAAANGACGDSRHRARVGNYSGAGLVMSGCTRLPASVVSIRHERAREETRMLTAGFNHVAIITKDADRLFDFYSSVFDAEKSVELVAGPPDDEFRLMIIDVGHYAEFNVFEMRNSAEPDRQTPMFGRGRIDHLALLAESLESFEEIRRRLMERGAADDFVTDFGKVLSVFFHDPDGLECEVCVANPDWVPGTVNPPGTPATRFVNAD